ncbi:hypothetical protein BOTBODRAFT_31855 [Botryobasidium botryosum FD-172 SS1]|uniref:Ubiquitin carboxyl-terminal hydrolase n=1 Tax=Botryobasidium botryosum (strain FD-172 SS1) TaxID=930990 RepID=A0A067MVE2_BOTB1|nr:hypothetical protein BOTBODRAFT_31855 [Botryobasidium botryosum FD-172 SS1]
MLTGARVPTIALRRLALAARRRPHPRRPPPAMMMALSPPPISTPSFPLPAEDDTQNQAASPAESAPNTGNNNNKTGTDDIFNSPALGKTVTQLADLLSRPIRFTDGGVQGMNIAEGKYEPIDDSKLPENAATNGAGPSQTKGSSTSEAPTSAAPPSTAPAPPTQPPPQNRIAHLHTGVIPTVWPQGVEIGSGFTNQGNTCFLNSVLQCLLHTPSLLHMLNRHTENDCYARGFCMACDLRTVAVRSHEGRFKSSSPFPIIKNLNNIAKHMRRGRQEDAQEFLRYSIDALQKSCLANNPQRIPPSKIPPAQAETTWVHKIFGGRLRSRVTCKKCHHPSDTFDSFLDLSLDVRRSDSVKEAISEFVAIDKLSGDDQYKCEKCKKPVNAEKQFTLHDAPQVLTVHLKRFTPMGSKLTHPVRYDERLSLAPYMSEGQFGPRYVLYGVISHAGGGPHSGHYYAHIKSASGKWFEMNDESVSPAFRSPLGLKNAYLLFYMRERGSALEGVLKSGLNGVGGVKGVAGTSGVNGSSGGAGVSEDKGKRKRVEPGEGDDGAEGGEDVGARAGPSSSPNPNKKFKPIAPAPDPAARALADKIKAAEAARAVSVSPTRPTATVTASTSGTAGTSAGAGAKRTILGPVGMNRADLGGLVDYEDSSEDVGAPVSAAAAAPQASTSSSPAAASKIKAQAGVPAASFYGSVTPKAKAKHKNTGSEGDGGENGRRLVAHSSPSTNLSSPYSAYGTPGAQKPSGRNPFKFGTDNLKEKRLAQAVGVHRPPGHGISKGMKKRTFRSLI